MHPRIPTEPVLNLPLHFKKLLSVNYDSSIYRIKLCVIFLNIES